MTKQKKSKIISFVTCLLILFLLVGGIGVICHFAGVGKDDITDIFNPVYRIECDGNVYKADTENVISVSKSGQVRFEVKNSKTYSVVVLPNVTTETDFTYTVDGEKHTYSDEKDLSKGFDLTYYDNAFTLNTDGDYSLESVLSKLYDTDKITINEHGEFAPYKIVVTSSSGEVIEIVFNFGITVIKLPESIVF